MALADQDKTLEDLQPEADLQGEPQTKDGEKEKLIDTLKHLQADFTNYKRHVEKQAERRQELGAEDVLAELVTIQYELEQALASKAEHFQAFRDGVAAVTRKLGDVVAKRGYERIPTTGATFNPVFHEAIHSQPDPEQPDDTIVAEVVPGFRKADRCIRPAKVIVIRNN